MKKIFFHLFLVVFVQVMGAEERLFFTDDWVNSHMKGYTEEEKGWIEKDLGVVRSVLWMDAKKPAAGVQPIYIATAGGPGSRKSTILERFMHTDPRMQGVIYTDPDQRSLKFMVHTYYNKSLNAREIGEDWDYSLVQKRAYDKWRPASNYISLTLLEEAYRQRMHIAHGVCSTGAHINAYLERVNEAGYHPILLLCFCEDDLRAKAIAYRNKEQRFYQSTPEDALHKGGLFSQRMPTYFRYGKELHLFWSDSLQEPEKHVATLNKGKLEVHDAKGYDKIVAKYERDRARHQEKGTSLVSWDSLIGIYREQFAITKGR